MQRPLRTSASTIHATGQGWQTAMSVLTVGLPSVPSTTSNARRCPFTRASSPPFFAVLRLMNTLGCRSSREIVANRPEGATNLTVPVTREGCCPVVEDISTPLFKPCFRPASDLGSNGRCPVVDSRPRLRHATRPIARAEYRENGMHPRRIRDSTATFDKIGCQADP